MKRHRLSYECCEGRLMLACDLIDPGEIIAGDANRDGHFDSSDLVHVFQAGEYEDDLVGNSSWAEGDWNGDGDFDSADLVEAFQEGRYSQVAVLFPDVLSAELIQTADNVYRVSVTLSSPYDTPARYADAWRVLDDDCNVLGIRILTHDHQHEQPFTRSLSGVRIPADIDEVTIQGRDQLSGWGGTTVKIAVPR